MEFRYQFGFLHLCLSPTFLDFPSSLPLSLYVSVFVYSVHAYMRYIFHAFGKTALHRRKHSANDSSNSVVAAVAAVVVVANVFMYW